MRIGYECRGFRHPYEPAEDTWQTVEAAEPLARGARICIDIGSGTGIVALQACREAGYRILVDLDPCSVEHLSRHASATNEVVQGDNLTWLRGCGPRVIAVYNTPYLPDACSDESELAWCGGLREALRTLLHARGCVLVVTFSSLSGSLMGFLEYAGRLGYRLASLLERHLFFETLYTLVLLGVRDGAAAETGARRNRGRDQPRYGCAHGRQPRGRRDIPRVAEG